MSTTGDGKCCTNQNCSPKKMYLVPKQTPPQVAASASFRALFTDKREDGVLELKCAALPQFVGVFGPGSDFVIQVDDSAAHKFIVAVMGFVFACTQYDPRTLVCVSRNVRGRCTVARNHLKQQSDEDFVAACRLIVEALSMKFDNPVTRPAALLWQCIVQQSAGLATDEHEYHRFAKSTLRQARGMIAPYREFWKDENKGDSDSDSEDEDEDEDEGEGEGEEVEVEGEDEGEGESEGESDGDNNGDSD